MSPIERLLNALPTKIYKRGHNKFQAVCPAHDDKSPSLSIAETNDGRVLMHCHGGCSTHSVLSSCGLEMHDLFPDTTRNYRSLMDFVYTKPDTSHADAVVTMAESDLSKGRTLSRTDLEAYKKAVLDGGKAV